MKEPKFILSYTLLLWGMLLVNPDLTAQVTGSSSSQIALVASTPGDAFIKSLLSIPSATHVDFIRWDLTLNDEATPAKTFVLNIVFGEGQPNTLGFKNGGEKKSFTGQYTISDAQKKILNAVIYQLKSNTLANPISLVKLNYNLFHLLTSDNKLLTGNGGWSYTLNRKEPLTNVSTAIPCLSGALAQRSQQAQQVIFDGRTPCPDFARAYNMPVGNDCIKLKWKLTLYRNPATLLPTTYTLNRTLHRASLIEGKWTVKNSEDNPDVVIYQLDPDKPDQSLSFLVGDENVIFFLDKKNKLFTGNENFSFTLNRREP